MHYIIKKKSVSLSNLLFLISNYFRMENTVLGNALEGVPEESSEEGEKQDDSKIESADNLDGLYFKSCLSVKIVNFMLFMYARGLK